MERTHHFSCGTGDKMPQHCGKVIAAGAENALFQHAGWNGG